MPKLLVQVLHAGLGVLVSARVKGINPNTRIGDKGQEQVQTGIHTQSKQRIRLTLSHCFKHSLLVGDKGTLYVPDEYGRKYLLLPKETFAKLNPSEKAFRKKMGGFEEGMIAHAQFTEWVSACKGGPAAKSNFVDYAGLLTEAVLLGNVAIRIGKRLVWDGEKMEAKDCPEAGPCVRPVFREGWML